MTSIQPEEGRAGALEAARERVFQRGRNYGLTLAKHGEAHDFSLTDEVAFADAIEALAEAALRADGGLAPVAPPRGIEGKCETCGHYMHAAMKVAGVIVQRDTYCSDCNDEHPFATAPVAVVLGDHIAPDLAEAVARGDWNDVRAWLLDTINSTSAEMVILDAIEQFETVTKRAVQAAAEAERDRLKDAPQSPARLLREFHEVFGLPIGGAPSLTAATTNALRLALIDEEVGELHEAVAKGDLVAVADALADIAYVTYGAADTWGIPLDAVIAEVHRSNMTKLGDDGKPIRREDGKVLKGPHYEPPNIAAALEGQGNPQSIQGPDAAPPVGEGRRRD